MAGQAAGTVSAGWAAQQLQKHRGWTAVDAYRVIFWAYAALGLCKLLLCLSMSPKCERGRHQITADIAAHEPDERRPLLEAESHDDGYRSFTNSDRKANQANTITQKMVSYISRDSWLILGQLCFLFALDSVASGLAPVSWMTFYFNRKFGSGEGTLGSILFVSSIISSALNLVSTSISKRIGLAKTMVLCHLPASITLAVISVPSSVVVAMALLVFRMSTKDMDTASRQAFVAAVVLDEERTAVMGIINIVRTIMISIGPSITGSLAGAGRFWIAFVIAGCLKIVYNIIIAVQFWNYQTKEEKELQKQEQQQEEDENEESRRRNES
jgi:Major Facilitator Superfamily